MRIIEDVKLDFRDVLIVPKRSEKNSRKEVDLTRTFTFKYSKMQWKGVPLIAANMDTVGTFEMTHPLTSHNILTCIHKHYTLDQWSTYISQIKKSMLENLYYDHIIYSVGTSDEELKKLIHVNQTIFDIRIICIDVANGYSQHFLQFVQKVRELFPEKIIIAGNIVTPEMTEALILAGSDIVKIGIGSGAVCTTRIKAGVGYPQLSAVIECSDAAHGLKGHIISDGGCTNPGDIAKAFGGGADFVMLGGMLAGHDQAGEQNIVYDGIEIKGVRFYGMSSATSMEKYYGGVASYRAAEGKEVLVPYKGCVTNTLQEILGGIRSTCTYIGASSIKEMPKRTTFAKVHQQHNPVYDKYVI